jgi:hypothetical protein
MAKLRSPNYPKHTLEEACRKVEKVYKAEHTHPAAREVVAKDLGYTSLNGASLTMIGTLNSYGLLKSEGDELRVSDDAVAILELPEGDPERVAALRRRAFAPKLFEELKASFPDKLPSDVNLRHYLIKKKFLPKAADEVIRTYRENLELVAAEDEEYSSSDPGENQRSEVLPMQQTLPKPPEGAFAMRGDRRSLTQSQNSVGNLLEQIPADESLNFRIADDCRVRLFFEGTVTQEALRKLIKYIELGIDDFPMRESLTKAEEESISLAANNNDLALME